MVEFIGNHGLPAFVDVNVLHGLDVPACHLLQGFDRCPALCLRLQAQPKVKLCCIEVFAHVGCRTP
ncbi:MAG: hypothetical protein EBR34_15365 [Sphingomonadaceae bacterium]|nr:hypothetical protein [Sphingomonadaceae bacterium]